MTRAGAEEPRLPSLALRFAGPWLAAEFHSDDVIHIKLTEFIDIKYYAAS